MAERARAVQESFEDRQTSTAEALEALLQGGRSQRGTQEGAGREGFRRADLFCLPHPAGCRDRQCRGGQPEDPGRPSSEFPNWKQSENALRELRKKVTFAIFAETDDLDRVAALVDELFTLLDKAERI